MSKYGHGTPDDWIERNLYTRYSWQGVGVMLIINLALFGAIGATVWAVQMLWIPITAAGWTDSIRRTGGDIRAVKSAGVCRPARTLTGRQPSPSADRLGSDHPASSRRAS